MTEDRLNNSEFNLKHNTLSQLRGDLVYVERNIDSVAMHKALRVVFDEYLYHEFGFDDLVRNQLLNQFSRQGIFPVDYECDVRVTDSLESARLALWVGIAPLYRMLHTSESFESWLPEAVDIVIPYNSRHVNEECRDDLYMQNDDICALGKCPIRTIYHAVEKAACMPDFSEYSYAIDADKTSRDTKTIIDVTADKGILTSDERVNFSAYYDHQFNTTIRIE